MGSPHGRLMRAYLWIAAAILAAAGVLYALYPTGPVYEALTHEDAPVQDVQALLLFLAFLLGTIFLRGRDRKAGRVYRWIPSVGLLGFLEETSFGQSVLHFHRPEVLGKHVDSLHDLGEVSLRFLNRGALGNLLGNVAVLVAAYLAIRHHAAARIARLVKNYPPFAFLLVGVAFYAVGCLSDFKIIHFPGSELFEETCELDGAIAILLAAVTLPAALAVEAPSSAVSAPPASASVATEVVQTKGGATA